MTTTFGARSSGPSYGSGDEDVDRRAGDLARLERRDQRGVVDEIAARGVDDPHAVAHLARSRSRRSRRASRRSAAGARSGNRRARGPRRATRSRRRAHGTARPRRTGRMRPPSSAVRGRAARPAGRSGRSRARRAPCRRARPRPTSTAPTGPAMSAACACGMLRASATQQPDRVLGRRDDVRLRRVRDDDRRGAWPPRRRRCRRPTPGAPDHLQPRPARRSPRRSPWSPSGRSARRSSPMISSSGDSVSTSTSKRARSSSIPASAIVSRTRTFTRGDGAARTPRTPARDGDAALDVGAELGQRQLDRRERASRCRRRRTSRCGRSGRSSPSVPLARRERDSVPVAEMRGAARRRRSRPARGPR